MKVTPWWPRPYRIVPPHRLARADRGRLEAACRRMSAPVRLTETRALCRVLGHRKMFVDPGDLCVSAHLLLDGFWEMAVTRWISRLVRPGMAVADVGANLGYFTLLLSDLVGDGGRVEAFEPNPAMISLLRDTLRLNGLGNVQVHGDPLGDDEAAELWLHVRRDEAGGAFLNAVRHEDFETSPIHIRRLDGVAGAAQLEFVKIDAEGSEEAIWRGMEGLLHGTRLHTLVLEWCGARYADPSAFARAIADRGFSIDVLPPSERLQRVTAPELAARPEVDLMLLLRR